ncbi:MAG: hypothetical protein QM477_05610 [Planctomycetota bacterium]
MDKKSGNWMASMMPEKGKGLGIGMNQKAYGIMSRALIDEEEGNNPWILKN